MSVGTQRLRDNDESRIGITDYNAEATKGFRALWSLYRVLKWFDETFRILCTTYIRPHIEYCIQTAGLYLFKDTNKLDRVQFVRTKSVKSLPKSLSMST